MYDVLEIKDRSIYFRFLMSVLVHKSVLSNRAIWTWAQKCKWYQKMHLLISDMVHRILVKIYYYLLWFSLVTFISFELISGAIDTTPPKSISKSTKKRDQMRRDALVKQMKLYDFERNMKTETSPRSVSKSSLEHDYTDCQCSPNLLRQGRSN